MFKARIPHKLVLLFAFLFLPAAISRSQQPFVTDDADTTPNGKFHFEFSNEFDWLKRSSFPNIRQNTADFELGFGLLDGVEIAIESPLLTIFNAPGTVPRKVSGVGDTNVSLKYNFRQEREHSWVPAMAIAMNLELPTGDKERQLGSGLADFYLNGIVQKSLSPKTKLRLNTGILFSGNQTTGAVGLKSRGTVFTAGGSLVKQITPKLQLGAELTGAATRTNQLGKGHLQTLVGANYQFAEKASFDFGVVAGKFDASPRAGIQLGLSIDF